ncbi:MAG: sigma-70 family RNA polymerase sigma factor [Chloroflexi bacterium]|nr:sigma-70 family RNA polymerase sigma factor [Chloroflexota bacterium]
MLAPDQELLVQFKQGDANAFRALVEQYTPPIYNLALRWLRDPMEAENITQETFLRVLTARDRVRVDAPFKPYLFRIAVNACRDRARKRQPLLFADLERAEELRDDEMFADGASPLWEQLAEQELYARVSDAVNALPPHYQIVITLRYIEELSYEDIAQTLDLPLNTVRTHLRRAKQQLRAHIAENEQKEK